MMDTFDDLFVDLQDVGCRIYTFVTTLRYVLEAAAGKTLCALALRRETARTPAGARRMRLIALRSPCFRAASNIQMLQLRL